MFIYLRDGILACGKLQKYVKGNEMSTNDDLIKARTEKINKQITAINLIWLKS
jgi:hypothetical protein